MPILGLAGCDVRSGPALYVEPDVTCGLLADVAAGAACALVVDPAGEVVADTVCAPGAEPVLAAGPAAGWPAECEAALGASALVLGATALVPDPLAPVLGPPALVPDTPVGCAVTCPVVGWWPERCAFDVAPAVPGEPVVLAVSEPSSALTLPAV